MSVIQSQEFVEIDPLNTVPTYGFSKGFPIIQFEISSQNKFLVGSSIRVNADVSIKAIPSGGTATQLVNNGRTGTGNSGAGRPIFNASFNNRVAAASVIHQITISNQEQKTLETIRNYPMFLAGTLPTTHSAPDFDCGLSQQSGNSSRALTGACGMNETTSVSIPLRCGLFNGNDMIPLSVNGTRGISIQLELAPDANAIGSVAGAVVPRSAGSVSYELSNVTLSYTLLVPNGEVQTQMGTPSSGSMSYNGVNHIYSVMNSSDQVISLNLGSQKVLSVHSTVLPTTHINNSQVDSLKTDYLRNKSSSASTDYDEKVDVQEVSFSRGGMNFPLEQPIIERNITTSVRPQTEILSNFINSIKSFKNMTASMCSLNTNFNLNTHRGRALDRDITRNKNSLPDQDAPVYGFGVKCGELDVGVDYSRQAYGLRIKSGLNGISPNSVFTYVLSQNTLNYSPNGVVIVN